MIAILFVLSITACQKSNDSSLSATKEPKVNLVPKDLAKQVAQTFNANQFAHSKGKTTNANAMPAANVIASDLTYYDKLGIPALYIFNFENAKGYIAVAADLSLRPVLAFINKGSFNSNIKLPEGMQDWISKTIENVEIVREGKYDNFKKGAIAWNRYLAQNNIIAPEKIQIILSEGDPCIEPVRPGIKNPAPNGLIINTTYQVGPLLPVTWGQACTYNDLCDLSHTYNCGICFGNDRPLTGCVATSMSQLMDYWQFPSGYSYSTMPTDHGNNAVQQLMRDAGNSVSMNYGCGASGAFGSAVPPALKYTFGFSSANRSSYNATSSYLNVRNNIDIGRPCLLEGQDPTQVGHEWLADGIFESTYTECGDYGWSVTYLYFHMNWGWHEDWMNGTNASDYNGWYAFDNWYIPGVNWNFQYYRYSVTEIYP